MTINNSCMQEKKTWKLCMHDNGRLNINSSEFRVLAFTKVTHEEVRMSLVRCGDLRGSNMGRGVPISEVSWSQEVES